MPRNKSEQEPTLEGVEDVMLAVLRADAATAITLGRTPDEVRRQPRVTASKLGSDLVDAFDPSQLAAYRAIGPRRRRLFIADYMEYLRAT